MSKHNNQPREIDQYPLIVQPREILAYTPVGLHLEKSSGWGTFLFTSSRACNLSCDGCWTAVTNSVIRKQLESGTAWLYDHSFGIDVLDAMLKKFYNNGGQLVACMSDGEPLIPANFDFIFELAKHSGNNKLPLLLFTNGQRLDDEKLSVLDSATKSKISYCISMQTGIGERYGDFMLQGSREDHAGETQFMLLEERFDAWRRYDQKILGKTGNHGVAIHTYVIPDKTIEVDMESVRMIVERLGNVPWIVSTMGAHVSDSLENFGKSLASLPSKSDELKQKYNTGPTATLSFGDGEDKKVCSYIAHGFFPFEKNVGAFGITFNPYNRGQVQTCPYHSVIGTTEWFALHDYLASLNAAGEKITEEHIGRWLDSAIRIETMVTTAAFNLAGYEHCLMRHSRKQEIDRLIVGTNLQMAERKKEGRFNIGSENYFDSIIRTLEETLGEFIKRDT